MTTRDFIPARTYGAREFSQAVLRLLRHWQRRRWAQRTVSTLHGLDDHTLKDIGLLRSEIDQRFRP